MWLLVALTIALFSVAVVVAWNTATRPQPWAPLGPYQAQQVTLPASGNTGRPTLHLSDPVLPVTARKCVHGDGFTITGTVSWQPVSPPGPALQTGTGTRDAVDGCITAHYENDVPLAVQSAMQAQLNRGAHPSWRVVGIETAVDGDRESVPETWSTEAFDVRP